MDILTIVLVIIIFDPFSSLIRLKYKGSFQGVGWGLAGGSDRFTPMNPKATLRQPYGNPKATLWQP